MERLVSADCPLLNLKNPINNRNLFSFGPTKKRAPEGTPLVLLIGFVIIPLVVFYL